MCTATCIERQLGKSCVLCHNLFPTTLTFPLEHWKSLNFFFGFADDVRSKIAPCVSHGGRRRGLGVLLGVSDPSPNAPPPGPPALNSRSLMAIYWLIAIAFGEISYF